MCIYLPHSSTFSIAMMNYSGWGAVRQWHIVYEFQRGQMPPAIIVECKRDNDSSLPMQLSKAIN